MRLISFLAGAAIALATVAAFGDEDFHTNEGFTMRMPDDWRDVPENILKPLVEKMADRSHTQQHWEYAYQPRSSNLWLEYPYILVQFISGRQSEASFRSNLEEKSGMQKGMDDAAKKTGIVNAPEIGSYNYDPNRHSAEFIMEANLNDAEPMVAFTHLQLTERGVIELCGYCTERDKEVMVPIFQTAAYNIQVPPDLAYHPRTLDHIPLFGAIDSSQIGMSGVLGGLIGLGVGLVAIVFRKKRLA